MAPFMSVDDMPWSSSESAEECVACFVLQTVSTLNGRTGLPYRPSQINLYQCGRMGVGPGDQHGYWWVCADSGYLYLQYNYRGLPGLNDVTACYFPIAGTNSWLTAPPEYQPSGFSPTTCVLVAGTGEGELARAPWPAPRLWRQGIEW